MSLKDNVLNYSVDIYWISIVQNISFYKMTKQSGKYKYGQLKEVTFNATGENIEKLV